MIKSPHQEFTEKHAEISEKLQSIVLPLGSEVNLAYVVGNNLKVSGETVRNYLKGKIRDGFLATAIYKEFKLLKKEYDIIMG